MNAKRMLAILAIVATLILPACARQPEPPKSPEQSQKKDGGGGGGGKEKSKEKDPVKAGVKQMRTQLEDLRVAVRAGDAAAARKSAQALDAKWEKIEGQVKAKDPEAYEKIERPLHAVVSGAGVTPFDQILLGNQINVLDQQLAQMSTAKKGSSGGGGGAKPDLKTGIAAMRFNLQQVDSNLEKDTAAAQKAAKEVDDTWEKVQSEVKKQHKDAYTKIEELMHNLMAAMQATPLDKKKVREQLPKLDAELQKLSQ